MINSTRFAIYEIISICIVITSCNKSPSEGNEQISSTEKTNVKNKTENKVDVSKSNIESCNLGCQMYCIKDILSDIYVADISYDAKKCLSIGGKLKSLSFKIYETNCGKLQDSDQSAHAREKKRLDDATLDSFAKKVDEFEAKHGKLNIDDPGSRDKLDNFLGTTAHNQDQIDYLYKRYGTEKLENIAFPVDFFSSIVSLVFLDKSLSKNVVSNSFDKIFIEINNEGFLKCLISHLIRYRFDNSQKPLTNKEFFEREFFLKHGHPVSGNESRDKAYIIESTNYRENLLRKWINLIEQSRNCKDTCKDFCNTSFNI